MRVLIILATVLMAWLGCLASATAESQLPRAVLSIAAASDLQTVMPTLLSRFERDVAIATTVSFGSSGNFFAQIQNGAPFDVFFSADMDYPRRLVRSGHAERDTLIEYATGHLVVWTRADSGLDVRVGLRIVTDERVQRIAIANPTFAPYGRAAVAALQHEQLSDTVKGKLVLGENVAQAAQFAQTGNAQIGIVSLSLARGPALKGGRYEQIPAAFHPPIQQGAVVLKASKDKTAARQLISYVRQREIATLLESFGFGPPAPSR
jgi:molybdate transport system substrate-binding protein